MSGWLYVKWDFGKCARQIPVYGWSFFLQTRGEDPTRIVCWEGTGATQTSDSTIVPKIWLREASSTLLDSVTNLWERSRLPLDIYGKNRENSGVECLLLDDAKGFISGVQSSGPQMTFSIWMTINGPAANLWRHFPWIQRIWSAMWKYTSRQMVWRYEINQKIKFKSIR